ncbi:hypothetical protein NEOLEDRAFT_1137156 [Neolentinus lepideus HHB14362 ss-1]|uniref:Uncharacterized protein n=1 Tax=Neolentinus lepideus HHB14362 ss-1 TaxID=1314782 RepID=A0A165QY19_9AGAM|nr:hypothetical protein NEOLEDRAFT_1137156 [Neolentinus lepideus HHB14362 ss-1]
MVGTGCGWWLSDSSGLADTSSGNRHLPMATYMGIPAYTSLCRPTEDYISGGFHYSISLIPDVGTPAF